MPRAASKLVPVVFRAGVKFSGDPSEQYTRVLAPAPVLAHHINATPTVAAIVFCITFSSLGCLSLVPGRQPPGARGSLRVRHGLRTTRGARPTTRRSRSV